MTTRLCVAGQNEKRLNAYLRLPDGAKINSQTTLKQLGFVFGNKPDVSDHIDYITSKFRKRLWFLRHLRQAGIPQNDLIALYKCFLVSILDYACVVYHPLLTKSQSHMLESLQASALKIIPSYSIPYSELLERSGLVSLQERRLSLLDKFIVKTAKNPRFAEHWSPRGVFHHHDLRREFFYEEKNARTERLYRSPLVFLPKTIERNLPTRNESTDRTNRVIITVKINLDCR